MLAALSRQGCVFWGYMDYKASRYDPFWTVYAWNEHRHKYWNGLGDFSVRPSVYMDLPYETCGWCYRLCLGEVQVGLYGNVKMASRQIDGYREAQD